MSDNEYSDYENNETLQIFSYEDFDESAYGKDHTDYRFLRNKHYYDKIRTIVSDYHLALGSKYELPTNYARLFKKKYANNYLADFESHYNNNTNGRQTYQIMYEEEGQVILYVNGKKSGYFHIDKQNYMKIFIYRPYRGLGLARKMICELLNQLDNPGKNDLFYVDVDMTDGFWDYIGCVRRPNSSFEKQIPYKQLRKNC